MYTIRSPSDAWRLACLFNIQQQPEPQQVVEGGKMDEAEARLSKARRSEGSGTDAPRWAKGPLGARAW
eukprot:scaffold16871_cov118-Isochrysis_galbana.AAC.2